MRHMILIAALSLCLLPKAFALAKVELTPEEKAQADFATKMRNPSKSTRVDAVAAFEATKPVTARSWQMIAQTMNTDPEVEVRFAAFSSLAKMPAHDNSIGKMLGGAFDAIKANDWKTRVLYAKAMNACEFKHDTGETLADALTKMRYAEDPRGYRGRRVTQDQRDEAKEKRDELQELLDAFNDIAHSDVSTADKDMPAKVRKWWDTNHEKLLKADAEILAKYAKEDADAAAAAKEAAKKK